MKADYKKLHEQHVVWCSKQPFYEKSAAKKYSIINPPPSKSDLEILKIKFGKIPESYLQTLNEFGLSEFSYDCYTTKMLSPTMIVACYKIVQAEMDFTLKKIILEEDGLDFSKYIPIMSGQSEDGCWALLNTHENSKGEVLYWNTNQAGNTSTVFSNTEAFILASFKRARTKNPLRLT